MCQSISADFLSSGLSFGAMAEEAGSSQGAGLQVSTWGGGARDRPESPAQLVFQPRERGMKGHEACP